MSQFLQSISHLIVWKSGINSEDESEVTEITLATGDTLYHVLHELGAVLLLANKLKVYEDTNDGLITLYSSEFRALKSALESLEKSYVEND